ncbi:MAG: SCO family protein [Aquifex sp.]|nr:MAG: SCO family protein [Aquifex sp.]
MRGFPLFLLLITLVFGGGMGPSNKAFDNNDMFDPSLLKIDERQYLGNFVPNVDVILEDGKKVSLYSLIKNKPTILLLSYYTCQGTCPVRIDNLNKLIKTTDLKDRDFLILNISFDEKDNLETLKKFKELHGPFTKQWVFGLIDKKDIEKLTNAVGFKFFFVERDKTFVHPNVYIFLSPEGRITRYLWGVKPRYRDVRIALAESNQDKISVNSIIDLAYIACFTYDPSRSRYVINPTILLGGIGFSALGIVVLSGILVNKFRRKEV